MEQEQRERLRDIIIKLKGENSQEWLAHRLGVSQYSVGSWLQMLQFPTTKNLGKIADYMGISISELLAEIQGKQYKDTPQSAQQAFLMINQLSVNEQLKLARIILDNIID